MDTTATPLGRHEREKAGMVGAMFDSIAHRYDMLNRLMSAGQDVRWRRAAAASLRPLPTGPLLDVGTGTADLALELRRQFSKRAVAGVDLSEGMLALGRQKCVAHGAAGVALARADVLRLPFAGQSFAGAATAFTLRNVAGLDAALAEIRRVLRPDGPFACLEITRPSGGVAGWLFSSYFARVMPRLTGAISGRPEAYRYLPASVERFVSGDELQQAMRAAGFVEVRMRRFWPGAVTLHTGRAPVAGVGRA